MEGQDSQRQVNNGPPEPLDDDTFERDLKEILEDAPNLNDLSSNVQSGSPQKMSASDYGGLAYNGDEDHEALGRMPRSFTVPPATSNVPLSTAHHNGDFVPKVTHPASSKLETIKNWSINTYKCTRQYLAERFGKGSKTVDLELEAHIEVLRDTQRKYANILRLARALTSHFYHVVQTQRQMSEAFMELSQKSPELQDEFTYNSETQRALVKNGETLLGALNFFTSSVNTLVHKTMEDTVVTIRQYEAARLEYDAYRNDVDSLQLGPQDSTTASRLDDARRRFDEHKDKFDRLRSDVAIKLKFLDENKVKVMHKQLLLFHNAVSAYFTGNESALDTTLKQFNIKLKAPNAEKPSWLEQ